MEGTKLVLAELSTGLGMQVITFAILFSATERDGLPSIRRLDEYY